MEVAQGVSPEDFKDILSDTSTAVSHGHQHAVPETATSIRYERNEEEEEEVEERAESKHRGGSSHSYTSLNEFKTAVAAANTAAAGFYRPVLKIDAIQNTLESFKSNKQAMFSSSTHASLAKSMAVRVRRDMEMQQSMNRSGMVQSADGHIDTSLKKARTGKFPTDN